MVKNKIIILSLFITFLNVVFLHCEDYALSLELSDVHYIKNAKGQIQPTVFLGDSFRLKLIVTSNKQRSTNHIKIKGIENFKTLGESASTSSVNINNASVSIKKTTDYLLTGNNEGTFSVGPASFKIDGTKIKSNTVTIHVAPQSEKKKSLFVSSHESNQSSKQSTIKDEIFCELISNKKTIFVEEQTEVSFLIYQRGDNSKLRAIQPPTFPDCSVKEVQGIKQYKKEIKGNTFFVTEKQFLIYPNKPGILNINPGQAVYHVAKQKKQHQFSFFDDSFFSNFLGAGAIQKTTASNELKLTVQPLPDSKATIESVGQFESFEAQVNKSNITINEPIKLSLILTGKANFDLILQPNLTLPKNVKTYDSKTETIDKNNGVTTKIFEFILQIPEKGTIQLPAQSFSYFDVITKKHATLETKPITLSVTIPQGEEMITTNKINVFPTTSPSITTDIHFIVEDEKPTQKNSYYIPVWFLFILLTLLPIFLYAKKITFLFSPILSLLSISWNKKENFQKELSLLIEKNETKKFYNFFRRYFSQKYHLPISHINDEFIINKLRENNLSQDKIESFITFLNECAQYSFSSTSMHSANLQNTAQKANYWLLLIDQTIKNKGV